MAAQDVIGSPNPSHVPAWKKLGLKLKFAKELPERSSLRPGQSTQVNDKKRKRDPKSNDESPQKKRVSFDAASKQTDGSSAKDLMTAWQAREDELGWTAGFIIPEEFDQKYEEPEAPTKVNKVKSKKTKQQSAKRAVNSGSDNQHSALIYLDQYHSSRAEWKFSKNKETWILKHLLSLDHIPSSYDLALRSYVSGLQSQAAKSRVRTTAEEAIHRDQEEQSSEPNGDRSSQKHEGEMEDPTLRRRQYDAALERYKKQLEDCIDSATQQEEDEQGRLDEQERRRLAKRKRAEAVLWEASSSRGTGSEREESSRSGSKRVKLEDEPKKPFNRKNRVSAVELSSSEDEDIDSDTSSSGSDPDESSDHEFASVPNAASDSGSDADSSSSGSDSDADSDSDGSSDEDTTTNGTSSRAPSHPTSQSRINDDTSDSELSDDSESESRSSRRSRS